MGAGFDFLGGAIGSALNGASVAHAYRYQQQAYLQQALQNQLTQASYDPSYYAQLQAQAFVPLLPRRTRQQWLELSMDELWDAWILSGDQTFDEWYAAHIPAADISPVVSESPTP